MSDDLAKRADEVLKDVTPGPWKHKRTEGRDYGSFSYWVPGICMNLDKEKDARFIAAARELVPAMRDRIEADAKRIAELARERDNWSETALMHLNAEQTFLSWLREAGEHMRSEGVTICDDGTESGEVLSAKVPMCAALLKSRADAAEARVKELEAANARLRGVLSGHQIWDSAEKVSADEFVLWAPDGHVAIRLKVTHRHDQLSEAGLEFLTCDLLDLLNARAALEGEK